MPVIAGMATDPQMNPRGLSMAARAIMNRPGFSSLSPSAQQTIRQTADQPTSVTSKQWLQAFNEANHANLIPSDGLSWWEKAIIFGGTAAMFAPAAAAALSGPAAAGPAAAAADGVLPATTVAGAGALPTAVTGMSAASIAGPAAAAGTGAAAATAATPWWQTALKYGAPIVSGAVDGALNQKNNAAAIAERRYETDQNNAQRRYEADQTTALSESKLDPFRGLMSQANDLKTLEHRSQGPRSYAPPPTSPYAGAVNPANAPPALSPSYQLAVQNAQDTIAQGQGTVPTMTNPGNYGQTGTQNLTTGRLRPRRPLAPPDPLGTYWI